MDNHAFASLAHVRILLLPVGAISQPTFSKYAAELRSFESIRLGDIPTDAKDERARFMPNPLSTGHLQLSFPTHPVPLSHSPLTLLRPSLFPLAVIGIAYSSHKDSIQSLNAQFNASLLDLFPAGGVFPITKTCFMFEEGDENTSMGSGSETAGVVVIPGMMGNKRIYIGTLLADVCSQILGGFGIIISALESPLGNEYLNSSVMPILPPLSEIPPPLNPDANLNALPPIPQYSSQPEVPRPFTLSAVPTLKRNSTAGPTFRPVQAPKKRLSAIGTASSHARLYKVLGDFFLLAGRTEDAAIWYNEALLLFKNTNDPVWQACTLEGMATISIIDSWSAGHGLQNSTTSNKEPWSEVSDKLIQAATLYLKAPVSDGEKTHSLMAYLYSCSILRHTNLLFSVWSAKGWGPLAFTSMLQPGPKPYIPPTLAYEEGTSWLNLERLSIISGINRTAISNVLSQLHGPWLLHLGSRERIAILEATAGIYACLGYRRKEAYILREVLGCIMDLMVCGREEDGVPQASAMPTSAGLGIHNFNPRPGDGFVPTLGMRMFESSDGNESILRLLKHTCGVLGIDLEAVRLVEEGTAVREGNVDSSMPSILYHRELMDEHCETFGWPELQVGVVREAVAVAEALPDFPAVAQFALSSLKTLQAVLSPGDQHHLYSTSARALMTARRRGDSRAVEYWSGRPILSISLVPIPDIRLPIEKSGSILRAEASNVVPLLQGGKDPFLYNPRKITAKGKSFVALNEILEFSLVLQNPYIFDLELKALSLSTSGVQFESQEIRVVIPASSIHEVILSGKATETGELFVRGCYVQTPGGIRREFILPLFTAEEEERFYRIKSAFACEVGRSKYTGLACLPWSTEGRSQKKRLTVSGARTTLNFLEFNVVAEQPLLRVRRASITHGALMLFNGETSSFRITIENVSQIPINFLRLAFEDSTIPLSQQALAEGDLSVFDTYETEFDLIHKPVFSWENKDVSIIERGQGVTLSISSLGKVGCTSGSVHISYANINESDPNLQQSDVFYTRQIVYPVMVTVYHALDCCGMDILPLPAYSAENDNAVKRRRKELSQFDDHSWCLFAVDIRNNYGMPFDVVFDRLHEDAPTGESCVTIPPGTMSRIVIPIEKIFLTEEQISKPIPTLSDRQFVVDKAKLSEADANVQRKLFWYREALFKSVHGRWKETGGTRVGEISLRQQRLSLPMLEVLRLENARVQLSLCCDDIDQELVSVPSDGGTYHPPVNEFVYLRARITNLTTYSVVFTMDIYMNPSEYVVHEGILSDISLGRFAAMESRDIIIPLCFLSNGRYEIAAYAYVSGLPHDNRRSTGHISAHIGETN